MAIFAGAVQEWQIPCEVKARNWSESRQDPDLIKRRNNRLNATVDKKQITRKMPFMEGHFSSITQT